MIFGEPWGAPICDDADVLPEVPVYADCLRCGETFTETDAGVVMPYAGVSLDARYLIGVGGNQDHGYRLVAEHRECNAAGVVGHMVGVCTCTGWDSTSRAAALEVQRRIDLGALHNPELRKRLIDTTEGASHLAGQPAPVTEPVPDGLRAGRGPSVPRRSGPNPYTEEEPSDD